VHENIKRFMEGFRYDAHPMAMMTAGVAALSSFYPSAKDIFNERERDIAFIRLLAKMPTLAAFAYRHVKGLPYVYPDNSLPYANNFLSMIARMSETKYEAHPAYARAVPVWESPRDGVAGAGRQRGGDQLRGVPPVWDERVPGGGLEHRGECEAVSVYREGAGRGDGAGPHGGAVLRALAGAVDE
jgi:hypothetical protein